MKLCVVPGVLALAGCSGEPQEPQPAPNPLFFEIANSDGEIEGWMLGTIHALPEATEWQTGPITKVIEDADFLIVEIADLDDRAGISEVFRTLARSDQMPDIENRVPQAYRSALNDLMERSNLSTEDFSNTETWAAALTLAQVGDKGDPEYGVDRVVIRLFQDREVREFEGALKQLRIFDRLPEADQRDLLEGVVEETREVRENPGQLREAWLTGDEATLEKATRTGIMADIELRNALLVQRNMEWTEQLVEELSGEGKPLVAVGTGHLVGPDSVNAMLETRGYRVTRIQAEP